MKNNDIALKISGAVIEGRELWSACDEFNGLLHTDLESGKTKLVGSFPEMPFFTRNAFGVVVKMDDMLVFVPGMAEAIYIYYIKEKEFRIYALPEEMMHMSGKFKFNQAVVYEKSVFMFGYSEPCIVCFDVLQGCLTYYGEWYREFVRRGFGHELILFDKEICILQNSIFFPPRNGDCIIEYNMEKRQVFFHNFQYKKDFYLNLFYDGVFFWTYGAKNQSIICMNDKFEVTGEWALIEMKTDTKSSSFVAEETRYFSFSYKQGNNIWLFSTSFDQYIRVNIEEKVFRIDSFNDSEDYIESPINVKHNRNIIYLFEPLRKAIHVYNDKMEKMTTLQIMVEPNELFGYLSPRIEKQVLNEKEKNINLSVSYLIWYLKNKNSCFNRKIDKLCSGTEIWKLCKQ